MARPGESQLGEAAQGVPRDADKERMRFRSRANLLAILAACLIPAPALGHEPAREAGLAESLAPIVDGRAMRVLAPAEAQCSGAPEAVDLAAAFCDDPVAAFCADRLPDARASVFRGPAGALRKRLRAAEERAGLDIAFERMKRLSESVILRSSIPPRGKKHALRALAGLTLALPSAPASPDLRAEAEAQCQPGGMGISAFYFLLTNQVHVCPGWVIHAENAGRAGYESELPFSFAMAHEIAHAASRFQAELHQLPPAGYWSCLQSSYPADYSARHPAFTGPAQIKSQLDSYAAEIAADALGMEAWVDRMLPKNAPIPKPAALDRVRAAFERLCSRGEDSTHPHGHWRLRNLVGRHPRVREALGCASTKPWCAP